MFENRLSLRSGNAFKSVAKAAAIGGAFAAGALLLKKAFENTKPVSEKKFSYFGKGKGRAYAIAESVERPANNVEEAGHAPKF